jgi:hypothetical protein
MKPDVLKLGLMAALWAVACFSAETEPKGGDPVTRDGDAVPLRGAGDEGEKPKGVPGRRPGAGRAQTSRAGTHRGSLESDEPSLLL